MIKKANADQNNQMEIECTKLNKIQESMETLKSEHTNQVNVFKKKVHNLESDLKEITNQKKDLQKEMDCAIKIS